MLRNGYTTWDRTVKKYIDLCRVERTRPVKAIHFALYYDGTATLTLRTELREGARKRLRCIVSKYNVDDHVLVAFCIGTTLLNELGRRNVDRILLSHRVIVIC